MVSLFNFLLNLGHGQFFPARDRIASLLDGEYSDIADAVMKDVDSERVSQLIKDALKILFEAISMANKGIVLGRFIEGMSCGISTVSWVKVIMFQGALKKLSCCFIS